MPHIWSYTGANLLVGTGMIVQAKSVPATSRARPRGLSMWQAPRGRRQMNIRPAHKHTCTDGRSSRPRSPVLGATHCRAPCFARTWQQAPLEQHCAAGPRKSQPSQKTPCTCSCMLHAGTLFLACGPACFSSTLTEAKVWREPASTSGASQRGLVIAALLSSMLSPMILERLKSETCVHRQPERFQGHKRTPPAFG
jgi:hypothetical protein